MIQKSFFWGVLICLLLQGCASPEEIIVNRDPTEKPVYVRATETPFSPELKCLSTVYASSGAGTTVAVDRIPIDYAYGSEAMALSPVDAAPFVLGALNYFSPKIRVFASSNQQAFFRIAGAITDISKIDGGSIDLGFNGVGGGGSYETLKVTVDLFLFKGDELIDRYSHDNYIRFKSDVRANVFVLFGGTYAEGNVQKHQGSPVSFAIREAVEAGIAKFSRHLLYNETGGKTYRSACSTKIIGDSAEFLPLNRDVRIVGSEFDPAKNRIFFRLVGKSMPVTTEVAFFAGDEEGQPMATPFTVNIDSNTINSNKFVVLRRIPLNARHAEVIIYDREGYQIANESINLLR